MMRLVLFVLLFGSAVVEAQDKIRMKCRPCMFDAFVNDWMKKTNRGIAYTDSLLAKGKPVRLGILKGEPFVILDRVFAQQPHLSYIRNGNDAILTEKPAVPHSPPDESLIVVVEGVVQDSSGNVLIGASIRVRDRPGGIATDHQGRYKIQMLPGDVVSVSHVGYITKEMRWDGIDHEMNVQLQPQEEPLQETVVSGYRNIHSSRISSISDVPIGGQDAGTLWEAARGRVPGVFITQENGAPGGSYRVNIRGQNSIGAVLGSRPNSEPLYVVDGNAHFMPEGKLNVLTSTGNNEPTPDIYSTGFNPLYIIIPSDIESITVLKDAVSTAMYGARGANGVVLIRTKRPSSGRSELQFVSQVGAGKSTRMMEMMNTAQYVDMRLEAFRNDGIVPAPGNASDLLAWDTSRNTNFVKYLLGGTAWTTQQQLTWSQVSSLFQFRLGGSYRLETSVLPAKVQAKRWSLFGNGAYTSKDSNLTLRLSAYQANASFQSILGYLLQAQLLAPHAPVLLRADGSLVWTENGLPFTNPLGFSKSPIELDASATSSILTVWHRLNDLFTFENSFSFQHIHVGETGVLPIASQNPLIDPRGSIANASNRYSTWSIEPQLHFNRRGHHLHITGLAGVAWFERMNKRNIFRYKGYLNDLDLHHPHLADEADSNLYRNRYRYLSAYAKVDLVWRQRYYFNITIRRDGSSRFGPDNRFGTFAAGGVAWVFSNDLPGMDTGGFSGKLHATYGITGNDQIGERSYLSSWTILPAVAPPPGGAGIVPATVQNKRLKWETVSKLEAGLELGLFNDQLLIQANWYRHQSSDQIIIQPLAGQSGFSSMISNFPAVVENMGLELKMSGRLYNHKITWTPVLTLTFPRNRLLSFPGLSSSLYKDVLEIGKSIANEKLLLFDRVDPQRGIYLLMDSLNQYSAGGMDPKVFGGFSNTFTYEDLTIEVFFEGRVQRAPHYLSYVLGYVLPGSTNDDLYNNLPVDMANRWRKTGDDARYQKLTTSYASDAGQVHHYWHSSNARFTDASFLRLKMIYLGYAIRKEPQKKALIKHMTLSLTAENIVTWTSYKATDPETLNPFLLPPIKRITLGISITI